MKIHKDGKGRLVFREIFSTSSCIAIKMAGRRDTIRWGQKYYHLWYAAINPKREIYNIWKDAAREVTDNEA